MRGVPLLLLSSTNLSSDGGGGDGERGVQFDSDYSGGEGASPFFLQVSGSFAFFLVRMQGNGNGLGYC